MLIKYKTQCECATLRATSSQLSPFTLHKTFISVKITATTTTTNYYNISSSSIVTIASDYADRQLSVILMFVATTTAAPTEATLSKSNFTFAV